MQNLYRLTALAYSHNSNCGKILSLQHISSSLSLPQTKPYHSPSLSIYSHTHTHTDRKPDVTDATNVKYVSNLYGTVLLYFYVCMVKGVRKKCYACAELCALYLAYCAAILPDYSNYVLGSSKQ